MNVQGTLNLLEEAVAPGSTVDRFVFTSTTSLMISQKIRDGKAGGAREAIWIDETLSPLEPRNIYGVTKRAAEELCRLFNHLHGLPILVLRTSRFFPEEDDMAHAIVQSGENTKANEFLFRRLSVEDAAEAHVVALAKAQADRLRHLHHLGDDAVLAGRLPRADRRRAVGRGALLPRLPRDLCASAAGRCSTRSTGSTTRARPSGSWASSAGRGSGKFWTGSPERSGALRERFRHDRRRRHRNSQAFRAATVVDRELVGIYRVPAGLIGRAIVLANVDLAFGAERPFDPQDCSRRMRHRRRNRILRCP